MPKGTRCCTALNGRVMGRSLNGQKNLLNICLMHLFAHSKQAILGLQWMLDCQDVPWGHDSCEYLLGFRKNKSHRFCTCVVQRSYRAQWLTVYRGMVFPLIFPRATEVFWVFTFIFWCIFSSCKRGFFGFYFLCFEILLYIYPVWPLRGLGFLKELDYVEHRWIRARISPVGGQVLYLTGLTTHVGGRLRSNHCNILYIVVIAFIRKTRISPGAG